MLRSAVVDLSKARPPTHWVSVTMAPTQKRPAKWKTQNELKYGVVIAERKPNDGDVVAVKCLFCMYLGRDNVEKGPLAGGGSRKRARTRTVKYFRAPFRTDNMRAHNESQHSEKWEEYTSLGEDERKVFFDGVTPVRNSLRAHFEGEVSLRFEIKRDIVQVLIEDLLFDPEADDAVAERATALRFFTVLDSSDSESGSEDDTDEEKDYTIVIRSTRLFHLIIKFVSRGASFRMAEGLASDVKEVTDMSCFVGASRERVTQFVRVVCASNLQIIGSCLRCVYAFGIALDVGSNSGTSYLDIRARFIDKSKLVNVHLLAIPLHNGKKAAAIFAAATKMLEVLAPEWKDQLIGVSTDGEPLMTGCVTGVATQFARATNFPCVEVWCGLHQVDLVVQAEYILLYDEHYVGILTALISYLRRQYNLQARMGSTCPKFMDTRWAAMKRVTSWLEEEGTVVRAYLTEKDSACSPPQSWWVLTSVLNSVACEISISVCRLQGLRTRLDEQKEEIENLVGTLTGLGSVDGPLSSNSLGMLNHVDDVSRGSYSCSLISARDFIDDQGSFAKNGMNSIPSSEAGTVERSVAGLFSGLVNGLSTVVAIRAASAAPAEPQIGPCIPSTVCKTRPSVFCDLVQRQNGRLSSAGWSQTKIDSIESQHRAMIRAYRDEPDFKGEVDAKALSTTDYDELWASSASRFPLLQEFCGGIAVIFPNTATVEADFSVIGWVKDDYRKSMGDFSLEGILQCKQRDVVNTLTK